MKSEHQKLEKVRHKIDWVSWECNKLTILCYLAVYRLIMIKFMHKQIKYIQYTIRYDGT
jgi:hypothetical protein